MAYYVENQSKELVSAFYQDQKFDYLTDPDTLKVGTAGQYLVTSFGGYQQAIDSEVFEKSFTEVSDEEVRQIQDKMKRKSQENMVGFSLPVLIEEMKVETTSFLARADGFVPKRVLALSNKGLATGIKVLEDFAASKDSVKKDEKESDEKVDSGKEAE